MKNKHDDHVATCFCCLELEAENDRGYSTLTPGVGFMARCGKPFGIHLNGDSTREEFHNDMKKAETCKYFNPTEV